MKPPACFLFTGNTEAGRGRGHPLGSYGSFRGLLPAGNPRREVPLGSHVKKSVNTRKVNK